MDFDFTPEQYALRDMARDLFEKESPPSRLRELYEGGDRGTSCWRAMAGAGLTGLTIAEEHGGAGGNEVDLALVLEEAGRAALPEPILETVAIGTPLIAGAGSDAQKSEWLPRIAAGDAVVTLLLRDQKYAVDAEDADLLIVEDDDGLAAFPRGTFDARRIETEDRARRLFAVDVPDAGAGQRMAGGEGEAAKARLRAAVATAGILNGVAMRLLEMTTAYVKARQQFGRPVGSFQAVKHRLADAHVAVESARAATWYGAYALAEGLQDAHVAASIAKAEASEAEAFANAAALQLHGGIGFTWEHDLHLWLKRGKALEQAYGPATAHRRILADHIFRDIPRDA